MKIRLAPIALFVSAIALVIALIIPGPQGKIGEQGIQGVQGIQGIQGIKGDNGTRGIQGIQGIKGDNGSVGPPGPSSLRGSWRYLGYVNSTTAKTFNITGYPIWIVINATSSNVSSTLEVELSGVVSSYVYVSDYFYYLPTEQKTQTEFMILHPENVRLKLTVKSGGFSSMLGYLYQFTEE